MKAIINPILRSAVLEKDNEVVEVYFDDLDEWTCINIGGKEIDVHFDYIPRKVFANENEWLRYILQAYDTNSEFEENLINEITFEI